MTVMRSMKFVGIMSGFVLAICACEQKNKPENVEQNKADSYSLVPDSTISFNIDKETSVNNYFYNTLTIDGEEFLGLVNKNINSIQIYSLTDRKLHYKIKLDTEGPNGFPKLGAFVFHNPDSIYIINLYAKNLWLIDIEGHVKNKFNPMNEGQPLFNLNSAFHSGIKPLYNKGKLYIPSNSKLINSFNLSFFEPDNKLEAEIDLTNGTWKYLNVAYPPFYAGNVWIADMSRDLAKDGTLVYSFAADPKVRKYAVQTGISASFKAESDYIKHIEPMVVSGKQEALPAYFVETPRYSNLIYDKYKDVYYRFARHELKTVNYVNGQNPDDDAAFSIIILDSSFDKIGETKIAELRHSMNSFFVTADGLYLSNTNPRNPELDEDVLSFTVFKLQKTK